MSVKTLWIYGTHAVRHALQNRALEISELLVQDNKRSVRIASDLIEIATQKRIAWRYVTLKTLDRIACGERHQGVVARYERADHAHNLDELLSEIDDSALFLVLDGVQDPHNLGACLRSANAVGARAVVIPKNRAAGLSGTVSKVACGGAEHTPLVVVTNLCRSLRHLQAAGVWIVGTDHRAKHNIYQEKLSGAIALVMGAEGQGLKKNVQKHCDKLVSIPMAGIVESLNVSVAAGVCLYEAYRQKLTLPK